ncbi:hypothetical protein K3495_g4938 [Podosphaera aphanis]|nr:hypothetical protein K3495_g4938 [Podosphaera aphanis]
MEKRVTEISTKYNKTINVDIMQEKTNFPIPEYQRNFQNDTIPTSSKLKPIAANTGRDPDAYLNILRSRCLNMEFSQHIRSLQPPEKYNGNPEIFQTWASELIEYFQNKQKVFQKATDRGLVVFAQSRLEGEPAHMIQQLALSGQEFANLFDLLNFLYQTFGIKDLYSHYERKYNDMKWPSGPNQSQNLAIFKAQIAPCKEILGWNNRVAILKILLNLPS